MRSAKKPAHLVVCTSTETKRRRLVEKKKNTLKISRQAKIPSWNFCFFWVLKGFSWDKNNKTKCLFLPWCVASQSSFNKDGTVHTQKGACGDWSTRRALGDSDWRFWMQNITNAWGVQKNSHHWVENMRNFTIGSTPLFLLPLIQCLNLVVPCLQCNPKKFLLFLCT